MPNLNLGNSDTYMPLLALVVLIYVWKFVHGLEKKFLLLYIAGSLFTFAITNILRYQKVPNLYLYHFYTWFELIGFVFYHYGDIRQKKRRILSPDHFVHNFCGY